MKNILFLTSVIIPLFLNYFIWAGQKYTIPDMAKSHIVIGESSQKSLDKQSIKLLVWNIYKGQKEHWSRDFLELAVKADLLLIQEGYLTPVMQEVMYLLGLYRFDFGISFIYEEDGGIPTGTTIGSKVRPSLSGLLRSKDLEPVIDTPKTITFGYYPVAGSQEKILVLNIHALNFTKQEAFERQIIDACNFLSQYKGPVIFAGDFNTRTKNRMKFLNEQMSALGLKELTFVDDDRMSFMGNPLDHVFVRGLSEKHAIVLPRIESSDHKPMYVELSLDHRYNL